MNQFRQLIERASLPLHYCFFVGSLLVSLYKFQQSQNYYFEIESADWDNKSECLLCWGGRDGSDLEWQIAKKFFIGSWILFYLGHAVIFWLIRRFLPSQLRIFLILYSSLVIFNFFSFSGLLVFYGNSFLYIVVNYLLGAENNRFRYFLPNYLIFCGSIYAIHVVEFYRNDEGKKLLFQVIVAWLNAKSVSASLDLRIPAIRRQINYNGCNVRYLIRRFAYLLYFPPLLFGPIYHFNDFDASIIKLEDGSAKLQPIFIRLKGVLRFIFWAFIFEISKQFIFSAALSQYIHLLEQFDTWSLAGYGFALTITFYLKYFILYGFSKAFSELDGLEGVVAEPPACIAHMHRTSYLWRHFDRGLYNFLVRYFYKPLNRGAHRDPFLRMLAGIVCFTIIALWHGLHPAVIIWVTLNVLLSAAEVFGTVLWRLLLQKLPQIDASILWHLIPIFGAPYLSLAYLSNVFFLSNTENGSLLWKHFYLMDTSRFLFTMMVFWSGNYVCEHINN